MSEFTDLIQKNLAQIEITNDGEALWATLCLIPFLDGKVDDEELQVLTTGLPKYLGQMRESDKNPTIDQLYRPFPSLNETDWPDLFKFVSHRWDLPERDDDGSVSLMSIDLSEGDTPEDFANLFERVQNSHNEILEKIINPIIEKEGFDENETGQPMIPLRATKYYQEYVDSFINIVQPLYENDNNKRDFFLSVSMWMMFVG